MISESRESTIGESDIPGGCKRTEQFSMKSLQTTLTDLRTPEDTPTCYPLSIGHLLARQGCTVKTVCITYGSLLVLIFNSKYGGDINLRNVC
jgi:hypothetical protein